MSATTWTPDRDTPKVFARLSGDFNPVHMDEEHARAAGFDTVIVHGMCVVGSAARASGLFAPEGAVLRELDVRFANPVLPDQRVDFGGEARERDGKSKVALDARLADGTRIMNPAAFTYGPAGEDYEVPRKVVLEAADEDVVGDVYRFTDDEVGDYLRITAPVDLPGGEGIPSMTGLLGMTGALEKAFRGVEPEHAGTWVHLRQQGVFYRPIRLDEDYVCRIQNGLTVVRSSKIGVHVTIPFLVETAPDRALVSSGACVLLYAFDRD